MAVADNDVIIPWGAGSYHFRHRWEAMLARWVMRRWSGWSSWDYLPENVKKRALRPRRRRP